MLKSENPISISNSTENYKFSHENPLVFLFHSQRMEKKTVFGFGFKTIKLKFDLKN